MGGVYGQRRVMEGVYSQRRVMEGVDSQRINKTRVSPHLSSIFVNFLSSGSRGWSSQLPPGGQKGKHMCQGTKHTHG
ncbi:hypothetical protein ACOMHN_046252 [Nucella lapillus]